MGNTNRRISLTSLSSDYEVVDRRNGALIVRVAGLSAFRTPSNCAMGTGIRIGGNRSRSAANGGSGSSGSPDANTISVTTTSITTTNTNVTIVTLTGGGSTRWFLAVVFGGLFPPNGEFFCYIQRVGTYHTEVYSSLCQQ